MSVRRLDHVGLIVEDLAVAVAFFAELGLETEGEATVSGDFPDRLLGLEGVEADIVMLRTPDGAGRVELSTFRSPSATSGAASEPVEAPGIPRLTFVVDGLEDTLARLDPHGATMVGDLVRYEDQYLYAYVRGPAGVVLGLVEELGRTEG